MQEDNTGHVESVRPSRELLDDSELDDSFLRSFARGGEPPLRPIPGEWLGGTDGQRFRILKDLGQGGMGLVLQAWDEVLHRTVALKFLAPQCRPALASLLRAEARAVARLDHENIVRILDLSEWCGAFAEEGLPFLVMEYLEGESLASLLRGGPLVPRHALDILSAVASGLAHAHARQVIHRDLKPGNVFLTQDGRVKLLDFGLASLAVLGTTPSPSLSFAGTPAYMAPEQWRGTPQDARTDIWAAGLLLFEMLTGALPFHPGSLAEIRAQVLSEAPLPSIRELHPEMREGVERILARTLVRNPERRFPGVEALREQVEALARTLDSRRAASSGVAEHRQVTLVACRLAGLSPRLGPGDENELVDAFQQGCQQILQRHGGTVTMGVGDELVACFGHPVAHEDDSEQAVRAGLELTTVLARDLKQALPHLPTEELAVRVGIHTDRVVMGESGMESRTVTTISGEAPKVAAWLAGEAAPGTVLLSLPTHALIQGVFDMEPLGSRPFPGRSRTVNLEVYRLGQERKVVSRFERTRSGGVLTSFVGREPELRSLLDLWPGALRGQGAVVLLQGEAGIGKSRLIQELRARAEVGSAWCWTAQCWRLTSNSAFFPVIELLQHVLGLDGEEASSEKRKRLDARMSALGLPLEQMELISLLLALPVDEHSPLLLLSSDERKVKTREALTALLLRMAAEHPVLFVLEDLQWADHSTLELLGSIIEHIPAARLLVLLSARTGFSPPWPPSPHLRTLRLERLSGAQTESLVAEVARGEALSKETVQHLVTRAEGVPLFIEELTRMVLERRQGDGDMLLPSIPVTLYELLLARLDLLTSRQKALAQLCAVVGRGVTPALLLPLVGATGKGRLEQSLSELVEAGVLQREPSGTITETRYQFRHALILDAAYQSLLRSTLRQHHGRIARLLEERFPQVAKAHPEWIAHHYTEAGEASPAVHYWCRAGSSANERSAYVEATGHLFQGLALLDALPDASTRIREEIRLMSALGLTLSQTDGYGAPRTEQTFLRIQELLRHVDAARMSTAQPYWALFSYLYAKGWLQDAREVAVLLLDVGRHLGKNDLLWQGHRMLGSVLLRQGELAAAGSAFEQARLLCAKPEVEPLHVTARKKFWVAPRSANLIWSAFVHIVRGQLDKARELEQDALRSAEMSRHPYTQVYVRTSAATVRLFRREPRGVLAEAGSAMALGQEYGVDLHVWRLWAQFLQAWALAHLGQPREGLQRMGVIQETLASLGSQMFLPESRVMRADILLMLGAPDEGLEIVRMGSESVVRSDSRYLEAELYRLQGELLRKDSREAEASQSFHQALAIARRQGARLWELRTAVSLGRQLQEEGRPGEALALLNQSSQGLDLSVDAPDFRDARELWGRLS